MKKGFKDYLAEANDVVETYDVTRAMELVGDEALVFVDVRDEKEIEENGKVPGAVHASRGMLEFYIDPSSPFHKEAFSSGKRFVFYCGSGGRSVLAAHRALEMGLSDVAHIGGGFTAWVEAGGPIEK